jgi:ubiquitin-protein ligase E3 C
MHVVLFEFLGRILGKALYEDITISPQFSHFFLSFLRGDYNYLHMLPDLSSVDKQLYNNLMFLKTYDGDAEDLCLTFSVAVDDFGGNREIPLIPNGANKEVTNANKQHYIGELCLISTDAFSMEKTLTLAIGYFSQVWWPNSMWLTE